MSNIDPNASQVGGVHYAGAYQHWDFVRRALQGRYLEGCATKYIARWRKKNGVQDLEKSRHYILKILSLFEDGVYKPLGYAEDRYQEAVDFCRANELGVQEYFAISDITLWEGVDELRRALERIDILLYQERNK